MNNRTHSPTKTAYKAQALLHVATGRHFPVDMPELPDGTAWQTSFKTQAGLDGAPLKVTPNPSSKYAELSYSLEKGQTGVFMLYDYSGSLLQSFDLPEQGSKLLDLSSYPTGMYFYSLLVDGNTVHCDKLVIAR